MGKSNTTIHNDGQRDGSNDKNEPPHSVMDEFSAFMGTYHKSLDEVHEENAAYRSGQENTK